MRRQYCIYLACANGRNVARHRDHAAASFAREKAAAGVDAASVSVARALGHDPRADLFTKRRRMRIERDEHHIGETATTGAPLSLIASRMPDIARIGSMLMKGLDGQMITARTSPERSAAIMSACGRASVAPSKASSWTTGAHCWRTK